MAACVTMAGMTEIPAGGPTRTRTKWWAVAAGALVVLLLAGAWLARPLYDKDHGASEACREFVTDSLKAPTTAEFSGSTDVSRNARDHEVAPNAYVVEGAVDSENGFGAMVRSRYTCSVNPDGFGWKLARPVEFTGQ